ncbi:MAG: methyltransferase domain-containing protein [Chrysiogenales bacterium]|nr:MAG: methyltransferase domain-containing protein [Chrysiogenales bacterium]
MEHNTIVDPDIEEYCRLMSTAPSPYCDAIYRYTMEKMEESQMLVGPLEAGFLCMLMKMIGALRVLEIGCFTGYSALAMAERLPRGGKVITIDYDEKAAAVARKFWSKSPRGHAIELHVGTALDILPGLQGPFDLVFIDADKNNYVPYLELTLPMLSDSGVVIADNTLWYGKVIDPDTNDPDALAIRAFNEYVSDRKDLEAVIVPMRDGMTLIRPLK